MVDRDFVDAVISRGDRDTPVRFSAVHPVKQEVITNVGNRIDWHLDLGISRVNPDHTEWAELDDLIQGNPCLKFRVNETVIVDVAGWFSETRSLIGNDPPDISLDVDLAWHDLEGPVNTVEALWQTGSDVQSLGHLTVREAVFVEAAPAMDQSTDRDTAISRTGSGFPVWIHISLLLLCTIGIAVTGGLYWLFESPEPLTMFLIVPVVFVCEQVFERFVPAKCPQCGSRLLCRIFSRRPANPVSHGVYNRSDVDRVPCYDCMNCDYQLPLPRHRFDDYH